MSDEKIISVKRSKNTQTVVDVLDSKLDLVLESLTSIKRQLILLNSRVDTIDERLREQDERETNRRLRAYAMGISEPIRFASQHIKNI